MPSGVRCRECSRKDAQGWGLREFERDGELVETGGIVFRHRWAQIFADDLLDVLWLFVGVGGDMMDDST